MAKSKSSESVDELVARLKAHSTVAVYKPPVYEEGRMHHFTVSLKSSKSPSSLQFFRMHGKCLADGKWFAYWNRFPDYTVTHDGSNDQNTVPGAHTVCDLCKQYGNKKVAAKFWHEKDRIYAERKAKREALEALFADLPDDDEADFFEALDDDEEDFFAGLDEDDDDDGDFFADLEDEAPPVRKIPRPTAPVKPVRPSKPQRPNVAKPKRPSRPTRR